MAENQEDAKNRDMKYQKFAIFGEFLYCSYSNLQMFCVVLNMGEKQYDRSCYMMRAKAFKAYKEGRWNIHDLLEFNVAKIKENNYCWYCEKEMRPNKLTKDHVFPKSKGGVNDMNNIIMICKECNSSKGSLELFEWFATVRHTWPLLIILIHYLKNIYLYSGENGLMVKHREELDFMNLPFNFRYILFDWPQPELYM